MTITGNFFWLKKAPLLLFLLGVLFTVEGKPVNSSFKLLQYGYTPKDSAKKKNPERSYGWDISAEYDQRQIYYGSYDSLKIASFSPEFDYLFKNGLMLSFSTATFTHEQKLVSEFGLGISWEYYIDNNWYGELGYSRYFNNNRNLTSTSVVLQRRAVLPNDFTTSIGNDNDIVNTSFRGDMQFGLGKATDFIGDLQNSHDFDIIYNEDHFCLSIGVKNELFLGSVNSLGYISVNIDLPKKSKIINRKSVKRTTGLLYDNIAIPLTMQINRFTFKPEVDYSIGFQKFVKEVQPTVTYLGNSPLVYFVCTVDYNLQKKKPRR